MRSRPLVRIQILLLVVLVGLLVWRLSSGPRLGDGFVRMAAMDARELNVETFELGEPAMIHVSATGAFETDESGAPLAVYGWINRVSTGETVWSMEDFRVEREGVLAHASDSLLIPAGRYEVWFTTLGPTPSSYDQRAFLGLKPHWSNYTRNFAMNLSAADGVPVRVVSDVAETPDADAFWSTGTMRNRGNRSVLVRVRETATVPVHAMADVCSSGCDEARIVPLGVDQAVWELGMGGTRHAGGWEANRVFDGEVVLEPGVYRIEFDASRTHGWDGWAANPPWNPRDWGLRIGMPTAGVMSEFDPWTTESPILAMLDVGSDENRRVQFEVTAPVRVMVDATGEISTGGTLYDFGQILRDDSGERVWRMSRDASKAAGGDATNRTEMAILELQPGMYTAYYETDDSHAYGDWRKGRPKHEDRWGMALFLLEGDAAAFRIVGRSEDWVIRDQVSDTISETPVILEDASDALISQRRTGNDVQFQETFTLDAPGRLRIVAMGEISTNGRYDYGWLERVDNGERIWEMTLQNTQHAGGDDRNRRFEGVIEVPAGTYVAHFVSDFSYAFGDFGDTEPPRGDDWGITIFRE